ncbi:hypothetical protein F4703DRAFT_1920194 [Phycomyces blakesleeanus]
MTPIDHSMQSNNLISDEVSVANAGYLFIIRIIGVLLYLYSVPVRCVWLLVISLLYVGGWVKNPSFLTLFVPRCNYRHNPDAETEEMCGQIDRFKLVEPPFFVE